MCSSIGYLVAALLVMVIGCSNPDEKPMQALLDKRSHGPEKELPAMLYGYNQSSPGAKEVLLWRAVSTSS